MNMSWSSVDNMMIVWLFSDDYLLIIWISFVCFMIILCVLNISWSSVDYLMIIERLSANTLKSYDNNLIVVLI